MAVNADKRNEKEELSRKEIMEDIYELTKAVSNLNKALLKLQNKFNKQEPVDNAADEPQTFH